MRRKIYMILCFVAVNLRWLPLAFAYKGLTLQQWLAFFASEYSLRGGKYLWKQAIQQASLLSHQNGVWYP